MNFSNFSYTPINTDFRFAPGLLVSTLFLRGMGHGSGEEVRRQLARRPQKALTTQGVQAITTPGKHFGGNGLCLPVAPNGLRFWVQRIVIREKRSGIGLGSPVLVGLAEARATALTSWR